MDSLKFQHQGPDALQVTTQTFAAVQTPSGFIGKTQKSNQTSFCCQENLVLFVKLINTNSLFILAILSHKGWITCWPSTVDTALKFAETGECWQDILPLD